MIKFPKIAALGDTHFPFAHLQTIEMFYEYVSDHQPHYVIQVGDLYDQFSQSRFPRKIIIDPYTELKESIRMATAFWKDIKKYAPHAKCIQILGNHDQRAEKRLLEKCPELHPIFEKGIKEIYTFDGVTTHHDPHEEVLIEGINITHGHGKHGTHMLECMLPTLLGHTHTGGTVFKEIRDRLLWELNCAYAADRKHEALKYRAKDYLHGTLGFGVVDKYGPRFIPWDRKIR